MRTYNPRRPGEPQEFSVDYITANFAEAMANKVYKMTRDGKTKADVDDYVSKYLKENSQEFTMFSGD